MSSSGMYAMTQRQRELFFSNAFILAATPMLSTFLSIFLWREQQSVVPVILFALGTHVACMAGFFVNGWLARFFSMSWRFFWGCLGQGIVVFLVILFTPSSTLTVFLLGVLMGLPSGVYWSNRNEITTVLSTERKRMGFLLQSQITSALIHVVMPAAIGYVFWYFSGNVYGVYIGLASLAVVLVVIAGVYAFRAAREQQAGTSSMMTVAGVPRSWNTLRVFEFFDGSVTVLEGILMILLGLHFLGLEDAIGFLKACTAAIAAVAMYAIGKHLGSWRAIRRSFVFASIVRAFAALVLVVAWEQWAFFVYVLLFALVGGMWGSACMELIYRAIDGVRKTTSYTRMALLADREVFLTLGRTVALVALLVVVVLATEDVVRYGVLLCVALYVPMVGIVVKQAK